MPPRDDNPTPADELLSAYLDGELTGAERAEVEARLAADPQARQTLDELRGVSAVLRSLPRESPNPPLADAVAARVAAAKGRPDLSVVEGAPELRGLPIGRSPRAWLWAGLAVAASLAVMAVAPEDEPQHAAREIAKRDAVGAAPAELRAPKAPGIAVEAEKFAVAEALVEEQPVASAAPAPTAPIVAPQTVTPRAEAFGAFDFAGPQPQLIVRVQLRGEAFRRRFVDQVLTEQGIQVEPGVEVSARRRVPLLADGAAERRGRATRQQSAASPTDSESPPDADADQRDAQTDVLLVEAPAEQFAAALSVLCNDPTKCNSVFVCPTDETQSSSSETKNELTREQAVQLGDWARYNRPVAAPQQAAKGRSAAGGRFGEPLQPAGERLQQLSDRVSGVGGGLGADAYGRRPQGLAKSSSSRAKALPPPSDAANAVQALVIVEADDSPTSTPSPQSSGSAPAP